MIDLLWVLIATALVFMMQAGFVCLESGLVRSKNSINVAAKNFMDMCVSGALFWFFGYAVMFGGGQTGWFDFNGFLFGQGETAQQTAFFLYQLMFCGTATTLVSGAVAERMSFVGYIIVAIVVAGIIYPIMGHWAWAGLNTGELSGWLGELGFIDFAGSTVVHSVGGWAALAAILVIGPRLGRFGDNPSKINGSNLPLSVLGVMLLWFGWFGFNGGSTFALNEQVPGILLNTCLAAIFGGWSAVIITGFWFRHVNVISGMNGVLGGLVGITASCHIVTPGESVIIGLISGLIVVCGACALEKLEIDDAIDAVPVHLFAGIWGTLAVALFGDLSFFEFEYSRWQQFQIQALGISAIGLSSFVVCYLLLKYIDRFIPLRVSIEAEFKGLNIAEHGASTEILDLLTSMEHQRQYGSFDQPVVVEPYTEVGQIATQYNFVLDRVNQEIIHRERTLSALKTSENRKGAILNAALDCIITINQSGIIKEFNPASEKCFGFPRKRVLGRNFVELFFLKDDREQILDGIKNGFAGTNALVLNRRNKTMMQRIHEEAFPVELTITCVTLKEQVDQEYTLHIRDVTRQLKLQNQLKKLAYQDHLTGLHNRYSLRDQAIKMIEKAVDQHTDLALMFLDLDNFKLINDSLGHKTGDELLSHIAEKLQSVVLDDGIISRWGGDEFVIVLHGFKNSIQINKKAEEILTQMRKTILVGSREISVLTSIGVALLDDQSRGFEQLVQRADIAMYMAKENGGDQFRFFQPQMQQLIHNRFYYKTELYQAITKNQLFLEYQPKVDSGTTTVIGFEALLRWQHPQEGLIMPNLFIPILEQSSLITEISEWVIEQVCKKLDSWKQSGLPQLPVAINLSGKYFLNDKFNHRLEAIMQEWDISGEHLEFELTETVLAQHSEQCIATMKQLKQLGVKFSIDDFGTGYSSMSYLKKFPIDNLKIDRSFINECDSNQEDGAICSAIIALAKNLDLEVIAEGVETEEQLQFLRKSGCDSCQGFYFYRPLSSNAVESLLQTLK